MELDRKLTVKSLLKFMDAVENGSIVPDSFTIHLENGFEIKVNTKAEPKRRSILTHLKLIKGKVKGAKKAPQQPGHRHGAGGLDQKPNIRIV